VLSVPFALRYCLAYDTSLVRDILQIFIRAVFGSIGRRADVPAASRQAHCRRRMRILCAINPPAAIRKMLDCLSLPSKPLPIAPALSDDGTDELWSS
jgi:hypothetical protein